MSSIQVSTLVSACESTLMLVVNGFLLFNVKNMNPRFLPPAHEVCEGHVFTSVCLSTGGVSAQLHAGIHPLGPEADPPGQTPPGQTPPGQTPPGRHPPGHTSQPDAPWADTPQQTVRILLECILVKSVFYWPQL